jgi:hypothetical protein
VPPKFPDQITLVLSQLCSFAADPNVLLEITFWQVEQEVERTGRSYALNRGRAVTSYSSPLYKRKTRPFGRAISIPWRYLYTLPRSVITAIPEAGLLASGSNELLRLPIL